MQDKNTKKLSFQMRKVENSFKSEQLTSYSGLSVIKDYMQHLNINQPIVQ
jgi:ribosomal protein S3AE